MAYGSDTLHDPRVPADAPWAAFVRDERPAALAPLAFELVTAQASFEALQGEWQALAAEHGLPHQIFLEFNWMWHWANIFVWQKPRPSDHLAIVVGRRGGRAVLIVPLVWSTRLGIKVLTWMGEPINQYGDALCHGQADNPQDWLSAYRFILKQIRPDLVHLRKVRADARIHGLFRHCRPVVTDVMAAPFIAVSPGLDQAQFESMFSAKDRKNRRRHRKRLQSEGAVTYQALSGCSIAAEAAGQAIARKKHWLQQRQLISPAVAAPEFEEFFRAALCDPKRPTRCELSMLSVSGKPAAMTIGIRTADYFAAHVTSYDPALETHSPGSLLLEDNLRRLHALGVGVHDFLAPAFKYKRDWTDQTVEIADYALTLSGKGALYRSLYLSRLRPRLRRLAETNRRHLRSWVFRLMRFSGIV